ncbi:unnamed protein product [Paramecium octaurelia]|uniref:Uncharacterized protein n=1 Tax=Paramecium octaurelia TaxID=43137 RepID=A0A8S1YLZ9_PAROT|nr:unnamed protein product [Paramecium octaurelia]
MVYRPMFSGNSRKIARRNGMVHQDCFRQMNLKYQIYQASAFENETHITCLILSAQSQFYNQMSTSDTNHFCSVQSQIFIAPINLSFTKNMLKNKSNSNQMPSLINYRQIPFLTNYQRQIRKSHSIILQQLRILSQQLFQFPRINYSQQIIQVFFLIKQLQYQEKVYYSNLLDYLQVHWCELISILKDNYLNLLIFFQCIQVSFLKKNLIYCEIIVNKQNKSRFSQNTNISSHINQELAKIKDTPQKNTDYQRIIDTENFISLKNFCKEPLKKARTILNVQ